MPLGCTADAARGLDRDGRLDRALMLALPPLAVLAAFALPTLQRSTAAAIDWFSVFFFTHRRGDRLGRSTWRCRPAMPAKLAANVAKLSPGFANSFSPIALAFAARRRRWPGSGWSLAHRPQPPSALEEPGPAGRRRDAVLAAGDDAAPAAARQRAQLPLDGAAHRAAGARSAACIVDAGHVAGAGRRARVPRRLAGRRGHAAGEVDAASILILPTPRSKPPAPRGCSWPANAASAATTTSSTSTSAPAGRAERPALAVARRRRAAVPASASALDGRRRRLAAHPRRREDEPEGRALAGLARRRRARRRGAAPRA